MLCLSVSDIGNIRCISVLATHCGKRLLKGRYTFIRDHRLRVSYTSALPHLHIYKIERGGLREIKVSRATCAPARLSLMRKCIAPPHRLLGRSSSSTHFSCWKTPSFCCGVSIPPRVRFHRDMSSALGVSRALSMRTSFLCHET